MESEMRDPEGISGYHYPTAAETQANQLLLPHVKRELDRSGVSKSETTVFDLGCGNGSIPAALHNAGWNVMGVDPSFEGIAIANTTYPDLRLEVGSAYDDLVSKYGQFPLVISLEVVEHVYAPRDYARTLFELVEPGGVAIVSTPYHGYLKNLALAATGRMDAHFTALWDHGHIKFWSIRSLTELLKEVGFGEIRFLRVGRVPQLARSMMAIARKS
jgi:2-polyprenyl-3-methyl-5-hydroxy-6-metoxy-1,4-benzoquinol methylase